MSEILNILGLAYKANKVILGKDCLNDFSKIKYLFIASDASTKTKERFLKKSLLL